MNLTDFYKKYPQDLKYNIKKGMYFHLILVGILSILLLSVKNMGELLVGQNPLSVAKIICRKSLNVLLLPGKHAAGAMVEQL